MVWYYRVQCKDVVLKIWQEKDSKSRPKMSTGLDMGREGKGREEK
jgi:hypothetical protein